MASEQAAIALRHVQKVLAAQGEALLSDGDLLRRFAEQHDEAAFETLVRRHGPMVLGVCRRALGNAHDAEDVFQATFLILARRAATLKTAERLGNWLYLVAYRLALRTRGLNARRRSRDNVARETICADPLEAISGRELCAALDEELSRLPEHCRAPLVLCCLEGATRDEAAQQLGWSLGTLKRRLGQGRALLRQRLVRRGFAPSAVLGAALLPPAMARAVPPVLARSTCAAALQSIAGKVPLAGMVSDRVLALADGMTRGFFALRLKVLATLILALTVVGTGFLVGARPEEKPPHTGTPRVESREPMTDLLGDPLPPGSLARLGTSRFRHENWIHAVAFSPDGRTLAAAGGEGITLGEGIILWDAATGRERGRLSVSSGSVLSVAYAANGKLLASGGTDHMVRLWDAATGKELRQFKGHKPGGIPGYSGVHAVLFTPDGRTLISRGADKTVRVWDVTSGKELRQWPGQETFTRAVALARDGRTLVSVLEGKPRPVVFWDVLTGKELRRLAAPADTSSVAFAPDGKTLATGCGVDGKAGAVILWDVTTGARKHSLPGHTGLILSVAFSADGRTLASGGVDRTIRLWDLTSAKELWRVGPLRVPTYNLTFAPGGKELVSWGGQQTPLFWDAATGKEARRFKGHETFVEALAVAPDGRLIASASAADVRLWDAATGKEARRLAGHTGNVRGLAFSGDGKVLAVADSEAIHLWDAGTFERRRTFRGPGRWLAQLAFAADGRTLAAWCDEFPSAIVLYDAGTGKELRRLALPAIPRPVLSGPVFSPDGKTLAVASGTDVFVRLWDVATGRESGTFGEHKGGLTCLALSADGKALAVGCLDRTLTIWETATRRVRQTIQHGDIVTGVAFSPNGRVLASANNGSYRNLKKDDRDKVRFWDVFTGKELRRRSGHRGGITGVAFAPNGKFLATGSSDTTVLLWGPKNWAVAAGQPARLTPREADALWMALAGADAAAAHRAMGTLVAAPGQAVALLKERVRPVVAADSRRTDRLLAALDSRRFAAREKARKELEGLGTAAEPALRRALKKELSPEARIRVERLLAEIEREQQLRGSRAVEVLEHLDGVESRKFLGLLAGGAAEAWLTQEAQAALRCHR